MSKEAEILLAGHEIKPTPNRILVLELLLRAAAPMTMTEIDNELETVDKSNVSRTLALFKEKHLVHSFEAEGEGTLYEVCHACGEVDDDAHVHFRCVKCGIVYCLEDVPVPQVSCPEGYEALGSSLIVSGICPKCK